MTAPRYSFAPVDARYPDSRGRHGWGYDPDTSAAPLTDILGISGMKLMRWRKEGLSSYDADALACSLGLNPVDLWPSWYDDAALEPRCAICDEPISGPRMYCSRACAMESKKQRRKVAA